MLKDTTWRLDEHGRAKHELLRRYLLAWFPILSKHNERVVFLDGFAGPGIYTGGEPGSPIVALQTLLGQHARVQHMLGQEFYFLFCEERKDRYDLLRERLAEFERKVGGYPPGVKAIPFHAPFADKASELVNILTTQRRQHAPTFAFIDPFGVSGLPMELLAQFLSFKSCELFVNFMYRTVSRFGTSGHLDPQLEELFGTDAFRQAEGLAGATRKQFVHDLYKQQLIEACKFEYVNSFEMIDKRGQTGYFLFHGTRHPKGVEVMKNAMWKVDPGGGTRFADRLAGQQILLQGKHVNIGPLKAALIKRFAGQDVAIEDVERYTLLDTPYRPAHLKQLTLKPLEQAGQIEVTTPRKRRWTYPARTQLRFLPIPLTRSG